MNNRLVKIALAVVLLLLLAGCGGNSAAQSGTPEPSAVEQTPPAEPAQPPEPKEQAAEKDVYSEIVSAERIDAQEAYEKLKDVSFDDPEKQSFVQYLKELTQCGGKFVQVSEETGHRYGAEVTFYLASGKARCAITYSGYTGEIKDGDVVETKEDGYRFEASPKGDLFGREQDFRIFFGNEQLRITWATSCDYTLTRGDGSAESVEDYEPPFDETSTFRSIVELIDTNYGSINHSVEYSKSDLALNIYFEGVDRLRGALKAQDSGVLSSWESIADGLCALSEQLLSVTEIGGNAYYVNIYFVDQLKDSGYTEADRLLWVQNGRVMYDYATASRNETAKPSSGSSQKSSSSSSSSSASSSTHTPTNGEKNALKKAHDYLDFTAFSHQGLIEQLEYEGFTYAESKYAADNCGADWNEQAVKKAKQYLDFTSFSRTGLIEQLEYEGFTHEQASYGVSVAY